MRLTTIEQRLREQTAQQEVVLETVKLGDIFAEEPVDLTTFITDKAFLGNPPLSVVQFDAVRHLEQVFLPETYPLMVKAFGPQWEPVRFINFAYLQWGKGSGKDHVCRLVTARVAYLILCLKDPQAYFAFAKQDSIHTLNVAASAPQANRAFFKPLRRLVKNSPWFKGKYETKGGDEPGQFSIVFDKNLESVSGHSEVETQEGLNILLGIADEISAFRTPEEIEKHVKVTGREPAKSSAAILKMIRTSARTRFPRNFKLAAISYPRFQNDAIQQLTASGMKDNEKFGARSRIYVSGPLATWDVNPRVSSKDEFREDYDEDPGMARAMYECKPDLAMKRFYRDEDVIFGAFKERRGSDPVVVEYFFGKDEKDKGAVPEEPGMAQVDTWQARYHFAEDLYPVQGAIYTLHADLALNGDRAGVAMCHVKEYRGGKWRIDKEHLVDEVRPVVKVDFMLTYEASLAAEPPREIQIRWLRKLVFALRFRGFYIGKVTFDRYESVDSMQILTSYGIESDRLSLDRSAAPWEALRDAMADGRLVGYWNPILVQELRSLMRVNNGKVDHPSGGSKDLADAVCGALVNAIELGGQEDEDASRAQYLPTDPMSGYHPEGDELRESMVGAGFSSFDALGPGKPGDW